MSRGRAYPIMKRTSHITLVVSEIKPTVTEAKKEKKTESVVVKTNDAKVTKKKAAKKAADGKSGGAALSRVSPK